MSFHFHQLRTRIARFVLCALLPALLLAQWVGLAHQIAHAGHKKSAPHVSVQNPSSGQQLLADFGGFGDLQRHSCASFDAATISECLHSAVSLPVVFEHNAVVSDMPMHGTWSPALHVPFLSRAPPQSVSV